MENTITMKTISRDALVAAGYTRVAGREDLVLAHDHPAHVVNPDTCEECYFDEQHALAYEAQEGFYGN